MSSDSTFWELVGARIQNARRARSMTQEDLADAIGRSRNLCSLIECGKSRPGLETFAVIAMVLDVSADWLLGRTPATLVHEPPQMSAVARKIARDLSGTPEPVLRAMRKVQLLGGD